MLKNLPQNQSNLKADGIYSCTGIYFFKSAYCCITQLLVLSASLFCIWKSSAFTDCKQGRNAFMALRREAKQNGIQDMSLDEINAEIQKARYEEDDT